jgi:PTS system nitrogen regulatory IIA component
MKANKSNFAAFCDSEICFNQPASTKKKALQQAALMLAEGTDLSSAQMLQHLSKREQLGSTFIGHGIAIPHARIPGIKQNKLCYCRFEEMIDYDDHSAQILIAIAFTEEAPEEHVAVLAKLAQVIDNKTSRQCLLHTNDKSEIVRVLSPITEIIT